MYGNNIDDSGCSGDCRRRYGGIVMYGVYDSRLNRVPVCHCAVCGEPLYEGDNVYEVDVDKNTEYICEKCIDDYIDDKQFEVNGWFKDYNRTTL